MASVDRKESCSAISSEDAEKMAKYGITRVPVDYFHYFIREGSTFRDSACCAKPDVKLTYDWRE